MKAFFRGGAAASLLIATQPAPASAQESAPQAFEHEVIVTGESDDERERRRAFSASNAATRIESEAMRDETPTSAADAVRLAAPSVSIQQTTPGQGTIYVRGLSGRAVVYAIDGVRLNMAFFRAGNNDYLGLIDPYALKSVIVVPGASSVEYGSDALGGGVLANTTTPGFSAGGSKQRFTAFQALSSNPLGTASRVAAVHEGETFSAGLGFTYYQAGPIRPGEDHRSPDPESYAGLERNAGVAYAPALEREQLGTEFEVYSADGVVRQKLGAGTSLVVRAQHTVRPELVRYDQVTPRFKSAYPARAQRSLDPMVRSMVSATLEQRRSSGLFDRAELQLAWQRIQERRVDRRLDEICVEPVQAPPIEPEECTGRLRLEPGGSRTFEENTSNAFTLRAEARKANADRSISVILGADAHHDIVSSHTDRLNLATRERTELDSRYPDGSTVSDAGIFGHARFRASDDFHVFAGARGNVFAIDMPGRGGDAPSEAFGRTVTDVVGSLGLHWEFAPGLAWVANGARGVRAPNLEDFAALGVRAQGRFQVPNPGVEPEHTYTSDTGMKLDLGPHRAQWAVFYTRYADAIALAPTRINGESVTPEGDEYYTSVNASSLDFYGAEASFDVELWPGLATFARALVMRGTQTNPAETGLPAETPADRVPPAQGELGLRSSLADDLEVEGFVVARAAQRRLNDPINVEDNRIPEGGTPGYATFHARMKYRPNPAVLTRLSLDNLTDRLALDHGSGFYRAGFGITASVEIALETPDS